MGERVTRADEIHLAVLRKANTLSWPVKKIKKIFMKGQHVELASKKKRKKERRGQHVELASKNTYEKQDSRCVTIELRCFK